MAGTHGDLFREIGALLISAHEGEAIDLKTKAQELSDRYANLGVSAETIARAMARSAGAVGISLALVRPEQASRIDADPDASAAVGDGDLEFGQRSAPGLFPSGVRLAVLS